MPAQTIDTLAERLSELEQNINTLSKTLADVIAELRKDMAAAIRTEHLNLSDPDEVVDLSLERTASGGLSIQNQQGSQEIGPLNEWWSHFLTSLPKYYFDKPIAIDGGRIGSYEGDLSFLTSINTGGNLRVTVRDDTGNIGIGTSEPAEKLHVNGNAQVDGLVHIKNANGSINIGPQNDEWSHFYTDRGKYYFNTEVRVNSGRIGSYDEDLVLSTGDEARVTVRQDNGDLELKKGLVFDNGRWKIEIIDGTAGRSGRELTGIQMNITHEDKAVLTLNNGNLGVPGLSVEKDSFSIGGVTIKVVDAARYLNTSYEYAWFETPPLDSGILSWIPTGEKRKVLKVDGVLIT